MISLYEAKITSFTQADYTKQYSLLECAIREKINSKQNVNSKLQSLAGYILLYRAFDELFPKKQVKITFNEHGKPMCDECFFSISHSEERVVCVVSDKPIGVDIQKIITITQREKYILFNDKENDYVNQDEMLISERFIEIFSKKESVVKMLGLTLSHASDIDTFSDEYEFTTIKNDGYFLCVCNLKD